MLEIESCQMHLDLISVAMIESDFALWVSALVLPLRLTAPQGNSVVATEDDLLQGFDHFVGFLRSQRITDLVLLARAVEASGPDELSCDYETHVIRNGHWQVSATRSRMTLRRTDGEWRTVAVANSLFTGKLVTPPTRGKIAAPGPGSALQQMELT